MKMLRKLSTVFSFSYYNTAVAKKYSSWLERGYRSGRRQASRTCVRSSVLTLIHVQLFNCDR
jgi:predicted transcriptional regulator